jgi:hypothetical protein
MAIEKNLGDVQETLMVMDEKPELEIEITNPEMVSLDDGSVEIIFAPELELDEGMNVPFDANLADYMEDGDLTELASELIGHVEADTSSRKEWADTFVKGLDVLGFKYEERMEPWEDACGVYSNVLAEAAIRFQAEAMSETFPAAGPVKTKILGEATRDKEDAALRVKADMNYELTEVMSEYRPEHERMLYSLGLAGSAFKKVYFDPNLGRQASVYIPAEDVIVPYGASNIETADPVSYHTDIEEKKAEEGGYTLNSDDRYTVLEIHADLVIEGMDEDEGAQIAKPYVVTIEQGTGAILAIRRNWNPDDPLTLKRQHFVHYSYVPGFGFYGLGLIHIIGGYAKAGTSLIRQLVDAGTLSNLLEIPWSAGQGRRYTHRPRRVP